ncbi:hypothetical protein K469DRAFT_568104, partial [Zopfia rhizophila CBS 207.26]
PLNYGIIQNFKVHYYNINCFNTKKAPVKKVTLEYACRWTLQSWNFKVSTFTIENCWRKSTITIEDTITVRFLVEDLTPPF